ncbi:MAG: hypothetical protein ACK2UV_00125 [Candidatus Promineifilaceae bacterium]
MPETLPRTKLSIPPIAGESPVLPGRERDVPQCAPDPGKVMISASTPMLAIAFLPADVGLSRLHVSELVANGYGRSFFPAFGKSNIRILLQ